MDCSRLLQLLMRFNITSCFQLFDKQRIKIYNELLPPILLSEVISRSQLKNVFIFSDILI